jgi:hypothetical protein
MRRIAATMTLMLIATQPASAQPATVINLSCDGTVKTGTADPEPVRKMGLVVNLAQHTVVGFIPIGHIDRLDDVNVEFSGQTDSRLEGHPRFMAASIV